jgi:hypothetical protein
MSKHSEEPRRQRDARRDAKVRSIEDNIERTYGLPTGSVQINNPDGTDARGDQQIGRLRDKYGKGKK